MLNIAEQVMDELRGTWRFHRVALVIAWSVSAIG